MLSNLVVENYALISKLEIGFRKGLTIVTGETGAGKSILLGALSLILGKRADTGILFNKDKKCIVEGTFDIAGYGLNDFFNEHGIDYSDQTLIRREISTAGKSRAFINDTPVNLETLTELSLKLIDIHSQHQNLNLSSSLFQMMVLDSFAQSRSLLVQYQQHYHTYRKIEKKFQEFSDEASRSKADLDYFQFQYIQLKEANLAEGEQEELEQEQETLLHVEEIKTGLTQALSLLQSEGMSVVQQLKESHIAMNRIGKFLHKENNLAGRILSSYIEIKDIAQDLEQLNNQLLFDPERLTQVNDRLTLIYNLEKKHKVNNLQELIGIREQLQDKISGINSYDHILSEIQKELGEALNQVKKSAGQLSKVRQDAIPLFENRIISLLHEVGIPGAGFIIRLHSDNELSLSGADHIQFLFSANKNMEPQDIAKVASGGEISRLMLCIKSLMSDSTGLPTIIFDEIDTGVSGDIAEKVGNIIFRMSEKMQIINITHLPQVASKGKYHYLVYKTDEDKTTVTRVKLLNAHERHIEIARMLSGEQITPAALDNARALLGK